MLPRTLVVATDFSEQAARATSYALELARRLDARVYVVHAYQAPSVAMPEMGAGFPGAVEQAADEAQAQLDALLAQSAGARVPVEGVLRLGDPVESVVGVAKQVKADLIVIGTHGRKGFTRAMLGSVAESVVRHAPCAVLTVR